MIPNRVLRSIERKCNDMVCPTCGGHHSVSLSEAKGVGAVSRLISHDACEAFQGAALNLIKEEINRFLVNPLPLIP